MIEEKIEIVETDSFKRTYWLTNDGVIVDISAYTFTGQVFDVQTDTKVLDFTIDTSLLASDKKIIYKLSISDVSNLDTDKRYYYYYQWATGSEKLTFLAGTLKVIKGGS